MIETKKTTDDLSAPKEVVGGPGISRRRFLKGGLTGAAAFASLAVSAAATAYIEPQLFPDGDEFAKVMNEKKGVFEAPELVREKAIYNFLGVAHAESTYNQNIQLFSQKIAESDVILLEFADQTYLDQIKPNQPEISMKLIQDVLNNPNFDYAYKDGVIFFIKILQKCADLGKKILLVNPQTELASLLTIPVEGLVGGVPMAIGFEKAIASTFNSPEVSQEKEKISRRKIGKLLMMIGAIFLGIEEIASHTKTTEKISDIVRGETPDKETSFKGHADIVGFSLLDYRNVDTAQKLLSLEAQWPQPTNVLLIQGMSHNAVRGYLENPTLAESKSLLYATNWDLLGDHRKKLSEFNPEKDVWETRSL